MTYTGIAGTFDVLHAGHKALLRTAMGLGQPVLIGITSDEFAKIGRNREVRPYFERALVVTDWLLGEGYSLADFRGVIINDKVGFALDSRLTKLVCSEETHDSALYIQKLRQEDGINPLEIIAVNLVLGSDGEPIHATKIREGKIDENGVLR